MAPPQQEEVAEALAPLEKAGWIGLALLAPGLVVWLSFNAGGYFPGSYGFVAVALTIALVLRTTLAERPFAGFSRALAIPLCALALYAGWQLLSLLWAHATSLALDSFDLTLLYLLSLALFGSVRWDAKHLRLLIWALFVGGGAVCLIGLTSRLLPHLWPTSPSFFASRLDYPLTYWNAEGMLAALMMILGLHLGADRAGRPWVRVLAAAALPGLAATLLLTFSRGAIAAAAIGLLAYCLLTRPSLLPSVLLATVAPVAIALRSAWDATLLASSHPTSAAAIAQGRHVALVVALCMLLAGVLRTALLAADARVRRRRMPRVSRQARAGGVAAAIFAIVAIALAAGAAGFVRREYDGFVRANHGPTATQTRERLSDPANNGRLPLWKAAIQIFDAQPLRGSGAGTYPLQYTRYRSEDAYVVDAHSLYLQSLAELGIVGLALIAIVALGGLAGLARQIRGRNRAIYAALLAAVLAWAVHQGFDWDWQMPAVSLGVLVLLGAGLATPAQDGRPGLRGLPLSRTLVALAWLLIAVTPVLGAISFASVQQSAHEMRRGECDAARSRALSSLELSAKRPQAYTVIGICDLEQGFAQQALPAMRRANKLEPQSWEGWFWLGVAEASIGSDPRLAMREAIALNPLEAGLRTALRRLSGEDPRGWEGLASRLRGEALASGRFAITNF